MLLRPREAGAPGAGPVRLFGSVPAGASGGYGGRYLGCLGGAAAVAGHRGVGALAEGVGVGLDDVDLPRLLAGAVHPHLVLEGVAAGSVVLLEDGEAGVLEAGGGGVDLVSGLDLDAEVVEPGLLAGAALDQDELERGRVSLLLPAASRPISRRGNKRSV